MPDETMFRLRSIPELVDAYEWLFNQQRGGKIDAKTAEGLNATLKGSSYLNGKLKLDALKIYMAAQIKKVEIPKGMLPE